MQTQAWRRETTSTAEEASSFSFRAINYLVRLLTAHDASWDAYFLGLGRRPLKITYEELAAHPSAPSTACSSTSTSTCPAPSGSTGRG